MTRLKKEVLEIKKLDDIFGVASRSGSDNKIIRVYEKNIKG